MASMISIDCGFRREVARSTHGESACCELLRRLLNDESGQRSRVERSACEYCFGDGKLSPQRLSNVIGSAILSLGISKTNESVLNDDAGRRLRDIAEIAISDGDTALDKKAPQNIFTAHSRVSAVDVIVPVWNDDPLTSDCIAAWRRQHSVYVVLHLVIMNDDDRCDWGRYLKDPNIRLHPYPSNDLTIHSNDFGRDSPTAALAAAHQITNRLETPFLAFSHRGFIPSESHLAEATTSLLKDGAQWYSASIQCGANVVNSDRPNLRFWSRTVLLESTVIRRSLWVDLNGMADRPNDADVEFFDRAERQGRKSCISRSIAGTHTNYQKGILEKPPKRFFAPQDVDTFDLHLEGIGFKSEPLACDVILPFRGQLAYVEEAIASVLAQTDIDLTLHLIDDVTPQDIDSWLRKYLEDDRIEIYRNTQNLGQFISFNNVVEFCKTDWLVTQDGDDVSLPGRLADSVQIAHLLNADLVGSATILNGPLEKVGNIATLTTSVGNRLMHHRVSLTPNPNQSVYFLENPTLVHRRAHFERIGGFADFADPLLNRTSVDSEFMLRSFYSGANTVACHRLAVRYRVHAESAIHSEDTRMGSSVRDAAQLELMRRIQLFSRVGIDPKVFGSLGRHRGLTVQWRG